MTKRYLYGKILLMKNVFTKKSKIVIISLLFALLIVCLMSLCFVPKTAQAESPINTNKYLPKTDLECLSLNSPIDVYSDDQVTAIVETGEQKRLLIEYNGVLLSPYTDFTAINQVQKLDSSSLLIYDNGNIYILALPSTPDQPIQKTELIAGGTSFALNSTLLATKSFFSIEIYDRNEREFTISEVHKPIEGVKKDTPITANDRYIFFVNQDGLCKYDINARVSTTLLSNFFPDEMIANTNILYLLSNGKVFKTDLDGKLTQLTFDTRHLDYDLGNITDPVNIAFHGDNLLIIQGNTIQEFKIENNQLLFTGYAISHGKTAYNRVNGQSQNATIQKYGDNVAILDDYKLTIINTNTSNRYDVDNYKNYVKGNDKLIGKSLPNKFALGKEYAFLIYNAGEPSCQLKLLNFVTNQIHDVENLTSSVKVRDVYYQSASFYLLIDIGNDKSIVYRIDENALSVTENDKIYQPQSALSFRQICVDLFGNIYLANSSRVIKVSKDNLNNYVTDEIITLCSNIKKLATDLTGSLFVLDDNTLKKYLPDYQLQEITFDKKITSFAFDFIDNDFYLLSNNDEFLSTAQVDQMVAIEDLVIPSDFKLTNTETNNALIGLKSYKIAQGENSFILKQTEQGFEFDKFATAGEEYIYVCPISTQTNTTLHLLAGQNDIVLTLSNTNCKELTQDTSVSEKAYVTPKVNVLYLPILTRNVTYYMYDEGNRITLDKNTEILPQFTVEFLGQTYYYAKFNVNDKEFAGYIPTAFTVTALSKDFNHQEYSIETVSKTNFYSNYELSQLVFEDYLEDGTTIRLIEKDKNVSKIAVFVDGEWIEGYISTKYIKDKPSLAIRNVLVILAVVTSLSATSVYFLLKKKKHN